MCLTAGCQYCLNTHFNNLNILSERINLYSGVVYSSWCSQIIKKKTKPTVYSSWCSQIFIKKREKKALRGAHNRLEISAIDLPLHMLKGSCSIHFKHVPTFCFHRVNVSFSVFIRLWWLRHPVAKCLSHIRDWPGWTAEVERTTVIK